MVNMALNHPHTRRMRCPKHELMFRRNMRETWGKHERYMRETWGQVTTCALMFHLEHERNMKEHDSRNHGKTRGHVPLANMNMNRRNMNTEPETAHTHHQAEHEHGTWAGKPWNERSYFIYRTWTWAGWTWPRNMGRHILISGLNMTTEHEPVCTPRQTENDQRT